ncbi:MAG: diguanylate cyclase [Helicobacter sp.]|nr:diguanylate cyclase [Helicobacteraceae bacterium]MDY3113887.1 diguanylate cyclase [Helicobacter sp.]
MNDDFGSFEGLQSFQTKDGIEESKGLSDVSSFSSFGLESSGQMSGFSTQTNNVESTAQSGTLEDYGAQIVQTLNANGIPPTPYNYKIYFEKLLVDKTQQFKDNVAQHIELEQIPAEKQALLESKVIKAQQHMINTLQQVGAIVKNLHLLREIIKKHEREVKTASNAISLQNIISIFEKELIKINEVANNQLQDLRNSYDKTATAISSISDAVICDTKYGVYNQRFLERRVGDELESVYSGGYKSSLLFVCIAKNISKKVTSEKTATIINRSLAKILQKVASKSDVIAYYGAGIFGILLSHSDKESTKKFANRLIEKVATTNMIIGEDEISLSVCTGIAEINEAVKHKEIIKNALEALKKAQNSNISFVVYGD